MADSGKEVIWICGHSGSGKTWMGDYLATRGFKHVDGDAHGFKVKANEESKRLIDGLTQAFTAMSTDKPVTEEMWKPFFEDAVKQINEALLENDKVVFTFALFDRFGEKDFIVSSMPNAKFVLNDVSTDTLFARTEVRNQAFLDKIGMTNEQFWQSEHMAMARQMFGDEYSDENRKAFVLKVMYGFSYDSFVHDGKRFFRVDNNDLESLNGVKELNKIVGLEDLAEIDFEAIKDVQAKRVENQQML